jgi:hypothetical protein
MWTSVGKRVMSHVLERTKLEVSPGESRVQKRPVFITGVLSALTGRSSTYRKVKAAAMVHGYPVVRRFT